mmetsp:Transcript_58484/g.136935  ORF Transcript_58484/g.136935 Transcript_58484/m.136935 type:complete len:331 (+) Transcript_58484:126-1118(+)
MCRLNELDQRICTHTHSMRASSDVSDLPVTLHVLTQPWHGQVIRYGAYDELRFWALSATGLDGSSAGKADCTHAAHSVQELVYPLMIRRCRELCERLDALRQIAHCFTGNNTLDCTLQPRLQHGIFKALSLKASSHHVETGIRLVEALGLEGEDLLEEGDHEPQQAQDRLAVPVLFLVSTSTPPKSEEKRTSFLKHAKTQSDLLEGQGPNSQCGTRGANPSSLAVVACALFGVLRLPIAALLFSLICWASSSQVLRVCHDHINQFRTLQVFWRLQFHQVACLNMEPMVVQQQGKATRLKRQSDTVTSAAIAQLLQHPLRKSTGRTAQVQK